MISEDGELKPSHGELLAIVKSKHEQLQLATFIEQRRLSVRRLEAMLSAGQPHRET